VHEKGFDHETIASSSPLPELPPSWDANVVELTVPINLTLASVQVRLDTGEFFIKFNAGLKGLGNVAATHHGELPQFLRQELETFCKLQIEKLYV
jgi:hypothetical protein